MSEERVVFTKEMVDDYTILIPNMMPTHFAILEKVFQNHGYKVKTLFNEGPEVVQCGLKYVHNDTCYPALLTIGQFMDALQSGEYDLNKTALMFTQTGGGCRASNYIHLLRKALEKAGLGHIPVISVNLSGLEGNSGFKITLGMLREAVAAVVYGDLLMLLNNQVRPYEIHKGESEALVKKWTQDLCDMFVAKKGYSTRDIARINDQIVASFEAIPCDRTRQLPKVGIVGEIYIKYSALGNNHLEDFLHSQGCEVMVPGLLSFFLFKIDNRVEDVGLYGGSFVKKTAMGTLLGYVAKMEKSLIAAVKKSEHFHAPLPYAELKTLVDGVIGYGCKMGEGWLLTAEMIELIRSGFPNIVSAQPFGCLPNHIVAKGMIRRLKEIYPDANIVPIDYDPGATRVNQENRIKLMLAVARENMGDGSQKAQ